MFSTSNLKTAAVVTGATLLVGAFLTSGKSKLMQGVGTFGATLLGLYAASKV